MALFAIFCGSRDWKDHELIRQTLRKLPSDTTIIHGAQTGADSISGLEADLNGFDVIAVPADWDSLGPSAGPERNERMLRLLLSAKNYGQDIAVFAFHEDPGLGKGTRHMVKIAKKAGVHAIITLSDGTVQV